MGVKGLADSLQSLRVNESRLTGKSKNVSPLRYTLRGRKRALALSKLAWNKDVWVGSMLLIGECWGEQRPRCREGGAEDSAVVIKLSNALFGFV